MAQSRWSFLFNFKKINSKNWITTIPTFKSLTPQRPKHYIKYNKVKKSSHKSIFFTKICFFLSNNSKLKLYFF